MNQNKNHNMDSRFDIIEVDTVNNISKTPKKLST